MADVNFAKQHFYAAVAHEDNFGNVIKSFYDSYNLARTRSIDAKDNEIIVQAFNYRVYTTSVVPDPSISASCIKSGLKSVSLSKKPSIPMVMRAPKRP